MKRATSLQRGLLRSALAGAALLIAAAAADEAADGVRFVVPTDKAAVRIHAEPDAESSVVDSLPLGTRVRFKKKRAVEGTGDWYFVSPPGRKGGWISGALLSEKLPAPPSIKKLVVDPSDAGLYSGRAALTSAGRGLDERAVQFALRKESGGAQGYSKATGQFRTLFRFISRIMADVPHDGVTKGVDGKAHPSGMMNEQKTADGRLRAGDKFKKELQ